MKRPILRLVQPLNATADQPPGTFVLATEEPVRFASSLEIKVTASHDVWHEYIPRQRGGGFVARHKHRPSTQSDNDIVPVYEIDGTVGGRKVAIALYQRQRPETPLVTGRSYRVSSERRVTTLYLDQLSNDILWYAWKFEEVAA